MNIKNRSSVVAAIFIGLSILACNLGAGGSAPAGGDIPLQISSTPPAEVTSGGASPSAGGCANPYIPIIAGATWNYTLTGPVPDTYTHSILSVEADGFTEQDAFGTGVTRQAKWKCDNGSLIALNPSGGGEASVNTEGLASTFETTEFSGVTFPANIAAGDTWSQSVTLAGIQTINGTEIPSKNQSSTHCTAIGIESIIAAAGTFDAMRTDCQTNMTITITMQGSEIPTIININSTSWYAPNIGMIKTVSSGAGFDSTVELISYNIP